MTDEASPIRPNVLWEIIDETLMLSTKALAQAVIQSSEKEAYRVTETDIDLIPDTEL